MRPARDSAAFTLLEMLVVTAILGVLFAVVMPAAWKTIESGRAAACMSNLRQVGVGLNTYLGEHDLTMPTLKAGRSTLAENVPVLDNTLDIYTREKGIFACPSDRKLAKTTGCSYYWNVALNGQRLGSLSFMKLSSELSNIPVVSDKEGFHPYLENKVNILYADGHATKDLKFVSGKGE